MGWDGIYIYWRSQYVILGRYLNAKYYRTLILKQIKILYAQEVGTEVHFITSILPLRTLFWFFVFLPEQ